MACMFLPQGLSLPPRPTSLSAFASSSSSSFLNPLSRALPLPRARRSLAARGVAAPVSCALRALIFDCDGVILESEHLHRQAYNDAFAHFGVCCSDQPLNWGLEFYDELQNRIGGGKPKMRWSVYCSKKFAFSIFGIFPETCW
ncbi:hypothetical protein BT93_L3461 [Corymbia citriodora subsp. variegata]|uniref:Uncharacterized protein n=1 Tax=Corymbia citriodora subsp. variegata TaxID=360336 RepID=A0A8T0CLV3_CORYI|nr:hypothetical protein BT93_L3461 [Corymbia citriodora subsp. variegata]